MTVHYRAMYNHVHKTRIYAASCGCWHRADDGSVVDPCKAHTPPGFHPQALAEVSSAREYMGVRSRGTMTPREAYEFCKLRPGRMIRGANPRTADPDMCWAWHDGVMWLIAGHLPCRPSRNFANDSLIDSNPYQHEYVDAGEMIRGFKKPEPEDEDEDEDEDES